MFMVMEWFKYMKQFSVPFMHIYVGVQNILLETNTVREGIKLHLQRLIYCTTQSHHFSPKLQGINLMRKY